MKNIDENSFVCLKREISFELACCVQNLCKRSLKLLSFVFFEDFKHY